MCSNAVRFCILKLAYSIRVGGVSCVVEKVGFGGQEGSPELKKTVSKKVEVSRLHKRPDFTSPATPLGCAPRDRGLSSGVRGSALCGSLTASACVSRRTSTAADLLL